MLSVHRRPDGSVQVYPGDEPLQLKHIQEAETVAQNLATIREEEVFFSGQDIHALEPYENAYWDFAECGRWNLARRRLAKKAREPRYYYVVICTEKRSGRSRHHSYMTNNMVTRAEALAAGSRKHPGATVTAIARKGYRRPA
jgi:hypothetical protein